MSLFNFVDQTTFQLIDSTLFQWAEKNSIVWYTESHDVPIRVFLLKNPNRRDRVQVTVDIPQGGWTTIYIDQCRRGLSRLARVEKITSSISKPELSTALDRALRIANEWASQEEPA
jgi:hypothetical protein